MSIYLSVYLLIYPSILCINPIVNFVEMQWKDIYADPGVAYSFMCLFFL